MTVDWDMVRCHIQGALESWQWQDLILNFKIFPMGWLMRISKRGWGKEEGKRLPTVCISSWYMVVPVTKMTKARAGQVGPIGQY